MIDASRADVSQLTSSESHPAHALLTAELTSRLSALRNEVEKGRHAEKKFIEDTKSK
jgi:hypothetical protein